MLSPTRRPLDTTIANGAWLTDAIDLDNEVLAAIKTPSAWTTAAISFQASIDGTNFDDLYDSGGTEVSIASGNVAANRFVAFQSSLIDLLRGVRYIKIRSGVTGAPVTQSGLRTLRLSLRQVA